MHLPRNRWLVAALTSILLLTVAAACRREEPVGSTPLPPAPTLPAATTSAPYPAASAAYPAPPDGTAIALPYPGGSLTTAPTVTAVPTGTNRPVATPSPRPAGTPGEEQYLPAIGYEVLPTPSPSPTHTPQPTPTPTIDFAAVRAELNAAGQDLAFVKFGFHAGVGGNRNGLGEWMRRLDQAGVPFTLKSVGDAGPLLEAQNLVRASGVPHVLIFRAGDETLDVPEYDLPPAEAARRHWETHKALFPPELDKSLVWVETINEVDKNRSAWLAEFAIATAQLALADGYRWAAFGWASGEPEVADWELPRMLDFLRLVAANPDRLAIALHEYSYDKADIGDQYPFKVGRFQQLFAAVDRHGIGRPTVLITEWGWEYRAIPDPTVAVADIRWAAAMYAPYPEIRGVAVWHLGCCFGDIADETQRLIAPLTELMLGTYFANPLGLRAPINPDQWRR